MDRGYENSRQGDERGERTGSNMILVRGFASSDHCITVQIVLYEKQRGQGEMHMKMGKQREKGIGIEIEIESHRNNWFNLIDQHILLHMCMCRSSIYINSLEDNACLVKKECIICLIYAFSIIEIVFILIHQALHEQKKLLFLIKLEIFSYISYS